MENHASIKPCIKCGSIRRYPAPPSRKTGQCINCNANHYKNNSQKIIEKINEWQKENTNKVRENKIKWKKNNKQKVEAQNKVLHAVKKNKLTHVTLCKCQDCEKPAEHYHHENYLKPLEVIPLCNKCHNLRHTKRNLT
jgi:hypothetical protein